jgi:hypothetical protein
MRRDEVTSPAIATIDVEASKVDVSIATRLKET